MRTIMNRHRKTLLFVFAMAAPLVGRAAAAEVLFVNDAAYLILEVYPDGSRSLFATGLNGAWGLACDSNGNLYEADSGSGNIYEFTRTGSRYTFASGLDEPLGLAFDANGDLFEADYGSDTVFEFTPKGTRSTFAAGLNGPAGLAFDSAGNLYEADLGSGNVYEFAPGGARSTFASVTRPYSVALDAKGDVFVGSGMLSDFAPNGAITQQFRFPPGSGGVASGLAFENGYLYAATSTGVVMIDLTSGAASTFSAETAVGLAFAPVTPGDANGDGQVDVNDLTVVLTNFGQTAGMTWTEGDFADNGAVNVNDLAIVLSNFGSTAGTAMNGVPEPWPSRCSSSPPLLPM